MTIHRIFAIAAALMCLCGCNGKAPKYSAAIKDLDAAIASQEEIRIAMEAKADSLRNLFDSATDDRERFRYAKALFDEYERYDLDSALVYAHANRDIAARVGDRGLIFEAAMDLADRYIISGIYDGALDVVSVLDTTSISGQCRFAYYHTLERIYHGMYLTDKDPERRQTHRSKSLYYNANCPEPEEGLVDGVIRNASFEKDNGNVETARKMLLDCLETKRLSYSDKASIHYWIAKTYRSEGDKDLEIMHNAISARYDRMVPVKASRSMISLARLLFETGDTDHAFKYVITAYEDATQADARIALGEINQFLPKIINSYEDVQSRSSRLMTYLILILLSFTITLGVVLIVINMDRNKIRKMQLKIQQNNVEIKEMNAKLEKRLLQIKEADQIKNTYLGRYMMMFSKHIDSLERYRSWLRVKSKANDIQELQFALRQDEPIEEQRKALFDEFDETFLALFPNFIEQLNSLLREDFRIGASLKPNRLSNELRIFALIRLGVTDSATIAQFLRKSPSTIYNYRVKLRNGALCDRDAFEKQLMRVVESI